MKVAFTVLGEPVAKGRPRFSRKGNYVKSYTPEKTVNYETLVRLEYERQCEGVCFPADIPLCMNMTIYMGIPKSASKKKQKQMLEGELRPLKRPDSSNICKSLEDALNSVAYPDDAQIVETHISRFYGDPPRAEIEIYDML